jgi:hypothetical protein
MCSKENLNHIINFIILQPKDGMVILIMLLVF